MLACKDILEPNNGKLKWIRPKNQNLTMNTVKSEAQNPSSLHIHYGLSRSENES